MDYSDYSFVLQGSRRKSIILALNDKAKTITELKNELKLNLANVSNTLKKLQEKGLVECKNPDDYHLKFYELTKKGKEIYKKLSEN
jgi:predicted transcriptional regulator